MITEHKLTPYPRRLWIAKGENYDNIKGQFEMSPEDEALTDEEINSKWKAIVISCNKDDYAGYLVFITDDYDEGDLVHEALHVALCVYDDCSMDISNNMDQEPLCYLDEYIWRLLADKVLD